MENLKDRHGSVIGSLTTNGTRTTLRNRSGSILGYYDSHTNKTYRYNGSQIGYGNILTTLL